VSLAKSAILAVGQPSSTVGLPLVTVARSSRRGLQRDDSPSLLPQDPITEPLPVIEASGNARYRPVTAMSVVPPT
jgi:hypothetical protein